MRFFTLTAFLLLSLSSSAQFGFTFRCAKDTTVSGCAASCLTLQTEIPDLKSSSATYTVSQLSGAGVNNSTGGNCFQPYVQPNDAGGTSANLSIDDRYTNVINLGFTFPFFGTNYTQLVASTNGVVSFDPTRANQFAHWSIVNGGPQNLPSTFYDRALIMGAYHDLDPGVSTSPTRRIQYQVVGTAPHRRWILSFFRVPLFSCNSLIENTHQIVIYESTGMIEVFMFSRQTCTSWNQGKAMIGLQNFDRNVGIMAPGRAATDTWGGVNMNEAWRFTPSGGTSLLRRVELYDLNGNLVSTGTTAPSTNGMLRATFPNVCAPTGTTSYVVRPVYQKIDDPTTEIYGSDTLRVTKTGGALNATIAAQPTLCDGASGSVTVTPTTGTAPYTYSLNGGAFQTSNTFSGLGVGNQSVVVRDNAGCSATLSATITLQNNLTFQLAPADTSICAGASFTPRVQSNATSYNWTPAAGLSSSTAQTPTITSTVPRNYTVTATLGSCTQQRTLNLGIVPAPQVDAGADQSIIAGDQVQLQATASPGTYLWSPATGLSATNILNPMANPTVTTVYTLRATNAQGCSTTDDVTVTVIPYCVKPMEAFTPNGDGINDRWLVTTGNCLKSARAEVFNRYGAKVFESADYRNNWDGTYNGKPLPDGTYYFVITYQLINGKTVFQRGNVAILR
jgi:gliding motility-associated-like protein